MLRIAIYLAFWPLAGTPAATAIMILAQKESTKRPSLCHPIDNWVRGVGLIVRREPKILKDIDKVIRDIWGSSCGSWELVQSVGADGSLI